MYIWACEYCIKKDLKKVQIYPLTETRIKVHEVTVTEDDGTKIKRMMEKKSFLGPQLGNQNPSCVHFWMRTAQGDAKAPTKASALSVSLRRRDGGRTEKCRWRRTMYFSQEGKQESLRERKQTRVCLLS